MSILFEVEDSPSPVVSISGSYPNPFNRSCFSHFSFVSCSASSDCVPAVASKPYLFTLSCQWSGAVDVRSPFVLLSIGEYVAAFPIRVALYSPSLNMDIENSYFSDTGLYPLSNSLSTEVALVVVFTTAGSWDVNTISSPVMSGASLFHHSDSFSEHPLNVAMMHKAKVIYVSIFFIVDSLRYFHFLLQLFCHPWYMSPHPSMAGSRH